MASVFVLGCTTYGVVFIATQNAAQRYEDAYTGAVGYKYGYGNNPGSMASALLVLGLAFWACQFFSDCTGEPLPIPPTFSLLFPRQPQRGEHKDEDVKNV